MYVQQTNLVLLQCFVRVFTRKPSAKPPPPQGRWWFFAFAMSSSLASRSACAWGLAASSTSSPASPSCYSARIGEVVLSVTTA